MVVSDIKGWGKNVIWLVISLCLCELDVYAGSLRLV